MSDLSYHQLRAPQADGTALIDPPLSQVAALIAANRAKLAEFDRRAGFPTDYRTTSRLLFSVVANVPQPIVHADFLQRPIILAGHQPTLFHPGVWLKNFLLSSIAKKVDGTAINLVIDNDLARTATIRVPSGNPAATPVVDIPFDKPSDERPWEERRIQDPETFRHFAGAVHTAFDPLGNRAGILLLDKLWSHAAASIKQQVAERRKGLLAAMPQLTVANLPEKSLERQLTLGHTLALARHELERMFGLQTYEAPMSSVSHGPGFLAFAEQLFTRHQEFHTIHNAVLAEYRLVNHVRNRLHPVPDLARDGDWFEMPFWIWTHDNPRRRRVFVRKVGTTWEVTDREGITFRPTAEASGRKWGCWRDIESLRIKLRPRALITTMYARLVLSDLFIHGIGGAKYDELTDAIIRRFFGIEPPAYVTATATFRLPIERPQVSVEDVRDVARRIRDVRFRPESFVDDPLLIHEPGIKNELQALADEKRNYLATHNPRRAARDVFAGLDRLNRAMQERLRPVEEHLRAEQTRLIEEARRARLLGSREFSFVLFPEEYLVPRLLELSKVQA